MRDGGSGRGRGRDEKQEEERLYFRSKLKPFPHQVAPNISALSNDAAIISDGK